MNNSAYNLAVETQGNSAAAIRSDRGGGTLTQDGGAYAAQGAGSPAVYCTADVTVSNATLTAEHSEAIVVEGKNSVSLLNCEVTGSMNGTCGTDSGENIQAVMIYQSMSGDADIGESRFSMTGGSLTALKGDLIYVTNTTATIELSGVTLALATENLLKAVGNTNSRGCFREGENSGLCAFTASAQQLSGVITVDEISSLDMVLLDGSAFEGAISSDGQAGEVHVTLEGDRTWTLTADAYVTSFTGDEAAVNLNGFTLHTAQLIHIPPTNGKAFPVSNACRGGFFMDAYSKPTKGELAVQFMAALLTFALFFVFARADAAVVAWGDKGTQVTRIQQKLQQYGYFSGTVDGVFGKQTYDAVVWFQRKNGLSVDGVVGPTTAAALGITLSGSVSAAGYNESESYLLGRLVHGEARGEPYVGKVAVAAVVLNRVKSPLFPNTISGVIYQSGAFDAVWDGQINLTPDADSLRAARDALNGWDPSGGCLYYYNPVTATNGWIWSRTVQLSIGKHNFAI